MNKNAVSSIWTQKASDSGATDLRGIAKNIGRCALKRILIAILAALIATTVAGCSANTPQQTIPPTQEAAPTTAAPEQEPTLTPTQEAATQQPTDEQVAEDSMVKLANESAITVPDGYHAAEYDGYITSIHYIGIDETTEQNWSADQYVELNEQQAIDRATEMLQSTCLKFSEKDASHYKATATGIPISNPDVWMYPAWDVFVEDWDSAGILRNTYMATIDMAGRVVDLSFGNSVPLTDEEISQMEFVSEEQAYESAVQYLQEQGHTLDGDQYGDPEYYMYEKDGMILYRVALMPKEAAAKENTALRSYGVNVDAVTGAAINWLK